MFCLQKIYSPRINGWYNREFAEIKNWQQPNHLVQGEKVWETLKKQDDNFTCSNLFFWHNMYSSVDNSVMPKPHYFSNGRKIPDISSHPAHLRDYLVRELGKFPFMNFWGPEAGIQSSQWIAKAAMVEYELNRPKLQLVYLPHLDYNLQRFGSSDPVIQKDVQQIDTVLRELIDFYEDKGVDIMIVSEYGISDVDRAVPLNLILREHGYISLRHSMGRELLDPGNCRAFVVADHQFANVYVKDAADISAVKSLLLQQEGVEQVLDKNEQAQLGMNHARSGELVAIAEKGVWFSYYHFYENKNEPDYARSISIFDKPSYDPLEMFYDPEIAFVKPKLIWKVFKSKMGFRTSFDIIPLDTSLVKGSHGRLADQPGDGPILIAPKRFARDQFHMLDLKQTILDYYN
ncbi:MAG: nucleotide pyrophosphatase/phosphodiesterase family protein [Bacteroidota bacterium]